MKWIHVIGGSAVFGSIAATFIMLILLKKQQPSGAQAFHRAMLAIGHYLFLPGVALQFITGTGLMHMAKFSFEDLWITLTLVLLLILVVLWIPVMKKHQQSLHTLKESLGDNLPEHYRNSIASLKAYYVLLLLNLSAIYYLMVFKPEV